MITLPPMNVVCAAADLLWSRVLKTFPDIRVALSEGGNGWIPYFLERLDRTFAEFVRNGVTDEEARKISYENACRWYSSDPFADIPKADATVGALRQHAAGHDISVMSGSGRGATPSARLADHFSHAEQALAAARS